MPAPASTCGHVVVFTLPGITWGDVARYRPPNVLAAMREGAAGSMSVRTVDPVTSYADAFTTMGAGSRMQGGTSSGGIRRAAAGEAPIPSPAGAPFKQVQAAGLPEIKRLATSAGYGAKAGALGSALAGRGVPLLAVGNADPGIPPRPALGYGRWALLAAMNENGVVANAAVGRNLLHRDSRPFRVSTSPERIVSAVDRALKSPCSVVFIDQGDLERADLASVLSGARSPSLVRPALTAADAVLGRIRARLDFQRDLLLILSPTSPAALPVQHLGVAIAVGPGFPSGETLVSASTRRSGFVTLPDVAPTILSFRNIPQPASMDGQPWQPSSASGSARLAEAVNVDREAVLVGRLQPPVTTVFVVLQVLVYLIALALISRQRASAEADSRLTPVLGTVVLAIVAFPVCTYLAGFLPARSLGAWGTAALLVGMDLVLVALVSVLIRALLDRLLALTALTTVVLIADLLFGARLQLSTVFGYSPIVAGRFAGLGNIGFAVLASATVLTGALVVNRSAGSRAALFFAGGLFILTIVADGLPALGSDVGGVIALVPTLIVTWVLLAGRRPTLKVVLVAFAALALAVGAFLIFDLSRPAASQTHLARLFEAVRSRGGSALAQTIGRKARANVEVFRSTVWTWWVPPAIAVLAWLLLRPRGRWQLLAERYPYLRSGLVGALLVGVLGFASNDSGVVIPAMVLSFFLPLVVLLHLSLMEGPRELS